MWNILIRNGIINQNSNGLDMHNRIIVHCMGIHALSILAKKVWTLIAFCTHVISIYLFCSRCQKPSLCDHQPMWKEYKTLYWLSQATIQTSFQGKVPCPTNLDDVYNCPNCLEPAWQAPPLSWPNCTIMLMAPCEEHLSQNGNIADHLLPSIDAAFCNWEWSKQQKISCFPALLQQRQK